MLTFNLESWKCWHFNLSSVSRQVGPAPLWPHILGGTRSHFGLSFSILIFITVQDVLGHICRVVSVLNFRWIFPAYFTWWPSPGWVKEFPKASGDMNQLEMGINISLFATQSGKREISIVEHFLQYFCCTLYVYNMLRWLHVSFRQDFLFP